MRKLTVTLLLAIVLAQTFYNVGVLAYWLSNHAYISAVLCENKDKPEMHCDGKCYLKKKIAESPDSVPVSSKNTPKPPNFKKGIELAEFPLYDFPVFRVFYTVDISVLTENPPIFYKSSYLETVFHPPSFV